MYYSKNIMYTSGMVRLTPLSATRQTTRGYPKRMVSACLNFSTSRRTPDNQIPAAGEGKRTFESVPKVMRRQVCEISAKTRTYSFFSSRVIFVLNLQELESSLF